MTEDYGPLPGQPAPAPEVIMEPTGVYWRRYPNGVLSMTPTMDSNDPTLTPLAVYRLVGWEDSDGVLHPLDVIA